MTRAGLRRDPAPAGRSAAQRCGTTYLQRAARRAPRRSTMARPRRPEPKVFLRRRARRPRRWSGTARTYFAHATDERLLGEKSTSYLEDPQAAGRAPPGCSASPQVVVLLRDPVRAGRLQLAVQHRQRARDPRRSRTRCATTWTTRPAWDPQRYLGVARSPTCARGRYADYLDPWLAAFPATHVTCSSSRSCWPTTPPSPTGYGRTWASTRASVRRSATEVVNESAGPATRPRRRPDGHARGVLRGEQPGTEPTCSGGDLPWCRPRRGGHVTDVAQLDSRTARPELPDIPFNEPRSRAASSTTSRTSIRGGHTSSGGAFARRAGGAARRARPAPRRCCSPRRAPRRSSCPRCCSTSGPATPSSSRRSRSPPPRSPSPARAPGCCSATSSRETLGLDPAHLATLLDDTSAPSWSSTTPASPATSTASSGVLADRPDVARSRTTRTASSARWRDRPLGSFGRFATLSFHETKNFICGEGGALVVNDAARRRPGARALRQGHQPARVPARPGRQVLLAGHRLVVRALRRARRVPARPARAARRDPGQAPGGAPSATTQRSRRTPTSSASGCAGRPPDREPAYHMFYVLLPDREPPQRRCSSSMRERRACRRRSTTCRCTAPTPAGGSRPGATECPVTDDISGRLLRLPFYNNLREPRPRPRGGRRFLESARRAARRVSVERRTPPASPARRRCGSPTTGGTAPGPTCSRPCSAPYLGDAEPHPRRRQRRRAERGLDARRRTSASPSTCSPTGCSPARACAARRPRCRSRDETFDVVAAFDVVEHCADEAPAVAELARVLAPGGRLLLSVPAYQWAWSDHDVRAGHHRRYTRPPARRGGRGRRAAGASGRRTPSAAVFPFFVAERVAPPAAAAPPTGRRRRLPEVSPRADRVLMGLCAAEARVLRRRDLPFGSSVFLAAVKPRPAPSPRRTGDAATASGHRAPRPRPRRTRQPTRSTGCPGRRQRTTAPAERPRRPRRRRRAAGPVLRQRVHHQHAG